MVIQGCQITNPPALFDRSRECGTLVTVTGHKNQTLPLANTNKTRANTGMKLTLNQAAVECGRAKSTISKALKTGKLSHEKGDRGAKLIDKSELHRVFPPTGHEQSKNPVANTKNEQGNSALQGELDAIRDKLETVNLERERERSQLTDQIEELREQVKEQRADFRQSLAILQDQREQPVGQGGQKDTRSLLARIWNKQPA